MKTVEQLAAEVRRAAYLAAADTVAPGRSLQTVYARLSSVDFIFREFAEFILNGKKGTPEHGNESNHAGRGEVAGVSPGARTSHRARHPRGAAAGG